jgi:hypothetical protein
MVKYFENSPILRSEDRWSWMMPSLSVSVQPLKPMSTQLYNMESANLRAEALRSQIANAEKKLQELKEQLGEIEAQGKAEQPHDHVQARTSAESDTKAWPLTQEEYSRYGRQMIVSSIGIKGLNEIFTSSLRD